VKREEGKGIRVCGSYQEELRVKIKGK